MTLPFELASPQVPSRIVESSVLTPKTAEKTVEQADQNRAQAFRGIPEKTDQKQTNLATDVRAARIMDPPAGNLAPQNQNNQAAGQVSMRDLNIRPDSMQSFGPGSLDANKQKNIGDSFFDKKRDPQPAEKNLRGIDPILRPQPVPNGAQNNLLDEQQNGPPLSRFVQTLPHEENPDPNRKKNVLMDSILDSPKNNNQFQGGSGGFTNIAPPRSGETPGFINPGDRRELKQMDRRGEYNPSDPMGAMQMQADQRNYPQINLMKVNDEPVC